MQKDKVKIYHRNQYKEKKGDVRRALALEGLL